MRDVACFFSTRGAGTRSHPSRGRAFTLIELLVALSIVAVLIGILVPVLGGVRREARRTQCLANLRSLGFALEAYRKDYKVWPDSPEYPNEVGGTISLARALSETGTLSTPTPVHVKGQPAPAPWRCPADDDFSALVGSSYRYGPGGSAQVMRFVQANNPNWRTLRIWEQVVWTYENNSTLALMTDAYASKVGSTTGRLVGKDPWHGFGPERQYAQGVFIDGSAGWDRRPVRDPVRE